MKIKRSLVSVIFVLSFLTTMQASTGLTKDQNTPEPYVASFNYAPEVHRAPRASGITFALGNIVYTSDEKTTRGADWRSSKQFSQLTAALKKDLPALLTAKGFGIRGPFDAYDLIPYSDKKLIDFYLIPTLELFATWKDTNVETVNTGFSGKVYRGTGTIEVSGNLTIKIEEIATRELLWSKSIPISYSFPYDVRFPYFEKGTKPFDMSLVMDDLAKGLEKQYPVVLGTLSSLIDPEEMKVLKKQAQELKKKKGY